LTLSQYKIPKIYTLISKIGDIFDMKKANYQPHSKTSKSSIIDVLPLSQLSLEDLKNVIGGRTGSGGSGLG